MTVPRPVSYGIVAYAAGADGLPRLLLLRAYRNWDFPKGLAEGAESPLAAARRELAEETGICEFDMPHGEVCIDTEPYSRGKVARYFIGRTRQRELTLPVSQELGRPEHDEYRWATPEQARSLLPPRLQPVLEWATRLIRASGAR